MPSAGTDLAGQVGRLSLQAFNLLANFIHNIMVVDNFFPGTSGGINIKHLAAKFFTKNLMRFLLYGLFFKYLRQLYAFKYRLYLQPNKFFIHYNVKVNIIDALPFIAGRVNGHL